MTNTIFRTQKGIGTQPPQSPNLSPHLAIPNPQSEVCIPNILYEFNFFVIFLKFEYRKGLRI